MEKFSHHSVIVYHDETKRVSTNGYKGHVLFFVPVNLTSIVRTPLFGVEDIQYSPQQELFKKINEIRQQYGINEKLHFTDISGKKWGKSDNAYLRISQILVECLRHKFTRVFSPPLNCKVAIMFYPNLADWSVYGGDKKEQKVRHDETILRILLKGAAHFLYNESNTITIEKIISDGNSEYRQLDDNRIIWRLTCDIGEERTPLRDYVTFSPSASILHVPSNHQKHHPDSENYIHANLLQMADTLLGSAIRSCYTGTKKQIRYPRIGDEYIKKDVIAQPIREMFEKVNRGKGFTQSGHYRSFTISQVTFLKDSINFKELKPIQDTEHLQIELLL